jgi:hypothetical protein
MTIAPTVPISGRGCVRCGRRPVQQSEPCAQPALRGQCAAALLAAACGYVAAGGAPTPLQAGIGKSMTVPFGTRGNPSWPIHHSCMHTGWLQPFGKIPSPVQKPAGYLTLQEADGPMRVGNFLGASAYGVGSYASLETQRHIQQSSQMSRSRRAYAHTHGAAGGRSCGQQRYRRPRRSRRALPPTPPPPPHGGAGPGLGAASTGGRRWRLRLYGCMM